MRDCIMNRSHGNSGFFPKRGKHFLWAPWSLGAGQLTFPDNSFSKLIISTSLLRTYSHIRHWHTLDRQLWIRQTILTSRELIVFSTFMPRSLSLFLLFLTNQLLLLVVVSWARPLLLTHPGHGKELVVMVVEAADSLAELGPPSDYTHDNCNMSNHRLLLPTSSQGEH